MQEVTGSTPVFSTNRPEPQEINKEAAGISCGFFISRYLWQMLDLFPFEVETVSVAAVTADRSFSVAGAAGSHAPALTVLA
jgi:hypothetical protein